MAVCHFTLAKIFVIQLLIKIVDISSI